MIKLAKSSRELWGCEIKKSETDKIEVIRENLKKLVQAHHDNDTESVISYHEKIDSALHSLVGKEGLRPEERK